LRPTEALEILALRPGATPADIKEAYRDLVKVWHPDRFGSDLRLRQKAEARLKEINEAYRSLQMNSGARSEIKEDRYRAARERPVSSAAPPPSSSRRASRWKEVLSRRDERVAGWIYVGAAIALVFLIGWFVFQQGATRDAAGQSPVPREIPAREATGRAVSGDNAPSTALTNRMLPRKEPDHRNDNGTVGFSVRSLSEAETSRLDASCSGLKEMNGEAIYQACIQAQLHLMTNAQGRPDLSGLNQAEGESIDSVCSGAGRGHRPGSYNRCLTAQMAEVMAEPVRPDLATLNGSDRSAVELACRNAKYREGPAAYDRCLARTIRLLQQTR
jgi:hypothetical protein